MSTENPMARYLDVPGAKVTLPVSAAAQGFSAAFVREARSYYNNFHWQMGGDHALYYSLRASEFLPTAVAAPRRPVKDLVLAPNAEVGKVRFVTKAGEMTLDDYVVHPNHRVQGVLIAHGGKVVYEAYPGMRAEDHHAWMSAAKTTVGLVLAQLEAEDKLDVQRPVSQYVPELKDSSWDGISVLHALNMATGLALEETLASIVDPTSLIVRFFSAEFGQPTPGGTTVEHWLDIVREAKPLPDEKPGEVNRYCSATTTVLNDLAEKIEGKPWIDIFQERVWSKLGARGVCLINLTPEGTAVAHGLVSSTLQDFARYALLFTPSWSCAAYDQVVSPAVLMRLQTGGSTEGTYQKGGTFRGHREYFGEDPMTNSWQFDDVFADGAMFKHGNLGQGIYVDPGRDVVGVYFSSNPYVAPYGEDKLPGFIRRAAKLLANK